MDFEKHAFAFGVTTGLFLSYLDIQLAHSLQILLWPECPEMIEEYLPAILATLEKIAEPNSAERWLVWISGASTILTLGVLLFSIWSSKQALKKAEDANTLTKQEIENAKTANKKALEIAENSNSTQKDKNEKDKQFTDDKVKFEAIKSLYLSAYQLVFNQELKQLNNNAQNWELCAKKLLNAVKLKDTLETESYKEVTEIERDHWQQKFVYLIRSDSDYRSLRAEFFFGMPNWQEQEDIIKIKLSIINSPKEYFKDPNHPAPKTNLSQKISIHSVCIVYFFAMNNMYLDDFSKDFNLNNPDLDIWREFTNIFDCFEESHWKKTSPLPEIIHEGAFEYIKHYLDINLVDIKYYQDYEKDLLDIEKSNDSEHFGKQENQLYLTFTDKKLTFINLDKVPNGKFHLHIKPEDIQIYDETKLYQFSFPATVKRKTNLSLTIRVKEGEVFILNAHHKNSPLLTSEVGDEITIGILNSTLYNEEGNIVEFEFQ